MVLISKIISTFFYIGFFPKAPGTVASLVTVLFWVLFISFNIKPYFIIIVLILFILSFYFVDEYLLDNESKDPEEVVIDEVVGQSIPLIAIPFSDDLVTIFLIFIFFRFFDILKIYPINLIEKINGSKGVMLDDVLAGIYTTAIVSIISLII